jgi:hypothetical protein
MATYFAQASVTISPTLIGHVKHLYSMAVEEIARRGGLQSQGPASQRVEPHWTSLAIPAYILAPAAVEAFLNEVFLSDLGLLALSHSPGEASHMISSDTAKSLEQLDLPTKLIEVPRAILGQSLDPGQQPLQDMKLLTQLRNELVHYKMGKKPPKAVRVLAQRGIAFRVPPEQEAGGPHPWADRVSTLAGIRWAYNTACATAVALLNQIPDERRVRLDPLRCNFEEIL